MSKNFILNNSSCRKRNSQENIAEVTKSTPVLETLILKNKVSSTPNCKVKPLKKKISSKNKITDNNNSETELEVD